LTSLSSFSFATDSNFIEEFWLSPNNSLSEVGSSLKSCELKLFSVFALVLFNCEFWYSNFKEIFDDCVLYSFSSLSIDSLS